jgi:hypothetical protein
MKVTDKVYDIYGVFKEKVTEGGSRKSIAAMKLDAIYQRQQCMDHITMLLRFAKKLDSQAHIAATDLRGLDF